MQPAGAGLQPIPRGAGRRSLSLVGTSMSVSVKKEWVGESGYCNCLLVAMSRIPIPSMELASNQRPPDLEALTTSRPKTCSWIRAQEFDYSALDSSVIIQTLAGLGGVKRSFWGYRAGTIVVHDCVEDDGPVVERRFHLKLARSKGALRLTVTLEGA